MYVYIIQFKEKIDLDSFFFSFASFAEPLKRADYETFPHSIAEKNNNNTFYIFAPSFLLTI